MRVYFAAFLVAAIIVAAGAPAARAMDGDVSADLPESAAPPKARTVADREDAAAQYHIGLMYERGQGAPQDYEEARRWYLKAAAHDDPFAEFSLGVLSAHGYGAPQDFVEAEGWFRRAAERGLAAAEFNLGVMYEHSLGAPQDYVLAHMWLSLAAAQGEQGARAAVEEAAARMSSAEIAVAERLARDWKPSNWSLRF